MSMTSIVILPFQVRLIIEFQLSINVENIGMNHCMGSTQGAPYVINSVNQGSTLSNTPTRLTAENDAFLALIDWVENNKTTDSIIATTYTNDDPQQGVDKQRPICLYPTIPKYNGGDINSSDSWSCN